MTWGPFRPNIDEAEREARLRALRALIRVLTGPRGAEAATAVLSAEISGGDVEALAEAERAFDRLGTIDQRRVISSYMGVSW